MRARVGIRWFYVAPTLLLFWIIGNIDKLTISVIISNQGFLHELNLTGKDVQIGLLVSSFTFAYGITSFGWGFVVDHIGPRRTALIGVSIWVLMLILGGASVSYGMLLVSRIVLGIGESVLWAVSNRLVANWFPHRERGRAVAAFSMGPNLGPAIGTPLIVAVMALGDWRWAFYVQAALSLVICLPTFAWLARDRPGSHPKTTGAERELIESGTAEAEVAAGTGGRSFGQIMRSPLYWLVVLNFLVSGFVFYGLGIWLPTYLEHARHFSASEMTGATSVTWIVAALVVVASGVIADRLLRPALTCAAEYIICGAALVVVSATSSGAVAAGALAIAIGFGAGGFFALGQALLHRLGQASAMGRAAGLAGGISTIVGGFSPTIIGWLVDISRGSFASSILLLEIIIAVGFLGIAILAVHESLAMRRPSASLAAGKVPAGQ